MQEHHEQNESVINERILAIAKTVAIEAPRIRKLGSWPAWMTDESLIERIPKIGDKHASGFDAGIASALDLFPREKQTLSAILHGAYTPEAIEQVRKEIQQSDPDSETYWWLTACSVCAEGEVNQEKFLQQIVTFKKLASDPEQRLQVAKDEYEKMTHTFSCDTEFGEGVPFGTKDGCMQGAYIAGFPFAVQFADQYGLYFIGTYLLTLGLEDFQWSDAKDEKGRVKSGPVFGSKQFVKCANKEEALLAIETVKQNLLLTL